MLNQDNVERLKGIRRPEYNKAVLWVLEFIWNKHPELRLIQLLLAIGIIEKENDWFYKENDVLFKHQKMVDPRETHIINYWVTGKPKMFSRRLAYIENGIIGKLIEEHKEWTKRKDIDILVEELAYREKKGIFI